MNTDPNNQDQHSPVASVTDTSPLDPLLALSRDQVTMFAMADAFRKAHDEHAALKIAKIFAAGQRAETNVIVGLRAALEVLSLRVPALERDHSQCSFSTGICGAITSGTGKLDENGYWEFPCVQCAQRIEIATLRDELAYYKEMHRAANARADGIWLPIESAPKNKRVLVWDGYHVSISMFGKVSHVPIYGWLNLYADVENIEIMERQPALWKELTPPTPGSEVKS